MSDVRVSTLFVTALLQMCESALPWFSLYHVQGYYIMVLAYFPKI